jgi:hypothetical protein
MANYKRKAKHRKKKGCGLCDTEKRLGNHRGRTKLKYRLQKECAKLVS